MATCRECRTPHPEGAPCPACHLKRKGAEGQLPFGHICPACGGTDLARSRAIKDSAEYQGILRSVECENCGATWKVIYRVGGYTDLHDPKH
jgi:hypothetical protein